jgi:hypothetical protein
MQYPVAEGRRLHEPRSGHPESKPQNAESGSREPEPQGSTIRPRQNALELSFELHNVC